MAWMAARSGPARHYMEQRNACPLFSIWVSEFAACMSDMNHAVFDNLSRQGEKNVPIHF
jgi:hypothetical protein